MPRLSGKRVLLLGAETDLGRTCAEAIAEDGASLALIAGATDGEAAFAVKRLARKLNAVTSQAIDASNEAAVRVMMRQVAKELSGLDAVVDVTAETHGHVGILAKRELQRSGQGVFLRPSSSGGVVAAVAGEDA